MDTRNFIEYLSWVWFTLLVAAWLFASPAHADVAATVTKTVHREGCNTYTLCNAETDTTAACDNGSDNIVADVTGKTQFTFYATESGATTSLACDIYSSSSGYSATKRIAVTSAAALTQLTLTAMGTTIIAPFAYIWAECTDITGGAATATVKALACSGE
jgi:hypothetical protein